MARLDKNMELLKSIRDRISKQPFGYGIGLASAYLETLSPCLADEQCSKMLAGVSNEAYQAALKKTSTELTFSHDECWEKGGKYATSVDSMKSILAEIPESNGELPKHCAMVFRNFITTNKMDRDRDILDPMGAIVDKSMPLLWQHLQPQPIGKLLGTIEQNGSFLKVASCICDFNTLAMDSIKMIEAGVLRISHGFKPKSFEMLPGNPGDQMPSGFHVKSYEVVEESVVSVPANSGAIIDAWASLVSKKSLETQIVKAFGERYWHLRDTANQYPSAVVPKSCTCSTTKNSGDLMGAAADLTGSSNPGISPEPDREDTTTDEDTESEVAVDFGNSELEEDIGAKGYSTTQRTKLAKAGKALPDGSFPILNVHDLKRAIKAIGRAKDPAAAKAHIIKRAASLGCEDMIPGTWKTTEKSTPATTKELKFDTKLYASVEGSYEWVSTILASQCKQFLMGQAALGKCAFNPSSPDYQYAYLEATMDGVAIISVSGGGSGSNVYYSVPYKMVDGAPKFDAEAVIEQVQAAAVVRPMGKTLSPYQIKSMAAGIGSTGDANRVIAELQKLMTTYRESPSVPAIEKALAVALLDASCEDGDVIESLHSIAHLSSVAYKSLKNERDSAVFEKELLGLATV